MKLSRRAGLPGPAAAAGLAVQAPSAAVEGPRSSPFGRVGTAQRRGGAGGGTLASAPPVGGVLVGQRGDGRFDAYTELASVFAVLGVHRVAEAHGHRPRLWP